jgi:hypothetical protein
MSLHVFLLIVCLFLALTLLWHLDWFPVRPSTSQEGAKRSRLHRLLKPRTPLDCPACCHSSPHLTRCGSITPTRASLVRGQKQARSGTAFQGGGQFGLLSQSLDSPIDSSYPSFKGTLPSLHFKQRGSLWPFMCSCSCSFSFSHAMRNEVCVGSLHGIHSFTGSL